MLAYVSYRHLQEVLSACSSPCRHSTAVVGDSAEDGELRVQVFVNAHYRGNIAAAIAVVWRRPHCDHVLILEVILACKVSRFFLKRDLRAYFVSFVDQLMGSGDQSQTVDLVELRRHFVAEEPAGAARGNCPRVDVFWVAPDKIAKRPFVRDLLGACNHSNLV